MGSAFYILFFNYGSVSDSFALGIELVLECELLSFEFLISISFFLLENLINFVGGF